MATQHTTNPKAAHLEALGGGKSLDQIAAMMAEARTQMRPDDSPKEVTDDTESDIGLEEAPGNEEENALDESEEARAGEADADEEVDGDEGSDGEAEADPEADEEIATESGEFELSDDVLVELEGLDEPVSFKDLREVYQADSTIKERIVQHDAALEAAVTVQAKAVEDAGKLNDAMREVVGGLESVLMQPMVEAPPDALKTSDPGRYIQHMEAYQQDQARIEQARSQIVSGLEQHARQKEEQHAKQRETALALLARNLPAIRDEKTQTAATADIMASAKHYGFTEDEVGKAADHRILLMAYDAQQYRKLAGMSKEEKDEKVTKLHKVAGSAPKVLRSKGTQKAALSGKQKLVVRAKKAASQTGRPDDVTAFIAAKRQARNA